MGCALVYFSFSEVCCSQTCFVLLLREQSCNWDLYKFVLISWPRSTSRYLLHPRIFIACEGSREKPWLTVRRGPNTAGCKWRGEVPVRRSLRGPPPALGYGGPDFGSRSQCDICSQNYTLIVSQRSRRRSRVLTALVSSSAVIIAPDGVLKNGWEKKRE